MSKTAAATILIALAVSGCVQRRPAGLTDPSLRAAVRAGGQGAFDPLSSEPRVRELREKIRRDPRNAAAHLELGRIYDGYRLGDAAWQSYSEALRQSVAAGAPLRAIAEAAVSALGRSALETGRVSEAIPLLTGLLIEWKSASAWNELGLLYVEVHDFPAAEEALRKALEIDPVSATIHNNLGVFLARRGNLSAALEQFQAVADGATAHNNLAVVLFEAGLFEQSREYLARALAIQPDLAAALANLKLVQERIDRRPPG